ncbi:MAG: hypothetical protein U0325_26915 [Polyangiales bacterium]
MRFSSRHDREVVLVFLRAPVHGAVKTRLAATLGPTAALSVYRWLATRTLDALGDPARTWAVHALVAGDPAMLGDWHARVDAVRPQCDGDLGATHRPRGGTLRATKVGRRPRACSTTPRR